MEEMLSETPNGPKSDIEELLKEFEKDGFGGLREYAKGKLEEWKKVELAIAVTGNSGVGKSSFINVYLDLADDDDDAVPIGVTETSNEIKFYKDKNNPKITFLESPGVGSPRFPQKSYFKDTGFDKYDVIILIIANRFTENDNCVASELQKKGKTYFMVRSKVWNDVQNSNQRRKKKVPETELISEIRRDCEKNTHHFGKTCYLFDYFNKSNLLLDYEKLRQDISDGLSDMKKEYVIRSLQAITPNFMKQKEQTLRIRICDPLR